MGDGGRLHASPQKKERRLKPAEAEEGFDAGSLDQDPREAISANSPTPAERSLACTALVSLGDFWSVGSWGVAWAVRNPRLSYWGGVQSFSRGAMQHEASCTRVLTHHSHEVFLALTQPSIKVL